uniref:RNase NYN domain-containing protein n=1 Tax=Panagrolaimus sp. ES5 TaxID=591445 RepID=A0AC34F639_9BILA
MKMEEKNTNSHPRLLLIDGYNLMHSFKELFVEYRSKDDLRMNAMVLVPLIRDLHQHGYRVRIVIKGMLVSERFVANCYILRELERMNLLLFPEDDEKESDDILMLSLAEQYGALIISNDAFANHQEYKRIAERNTIKYSRICNNNFKIETLEKELAFQYLISFEGVGDRFYCCKDDPDYEKVTLSYDIFRPLSQTTQKHLDLLHVYIYAELCSLLGVPRPTEIGFLKEDETLPRFHEFKSRMFI